jgi:hypothetical protein
MLVEKANVEMEDLLAYDMKTKVTGLDDAGMDWANCNLIGIVPLHRYCPVIKRNSVVEQWAQWFVAVEG